MGLFKRLLKNIENISENRELRVLRIQNRVCGFTGETQNKKIP